MDVWDSVTQVITQKGFAVSDRACRVFTAGVVGHFDDAAGDETAAFDYAASSRQLLNAYSPRVSCLSFETTSVFGYVVPPSFSSRSHQQWLTQMYFGGTTMVSLSRFQELKELT
jgi:hypothetical protein